MTDQTTPEPDLFVLWLDASDGSIATCDGVRWPDGTATVHHRHFAGMASTHHSPEAAAWAAHGKQARIVWADASGRSEPSPACGEECAEGHTYTGRCAQAGTGCASPDGCPNLADCHHGCRWCADELTRMWEDDARTTPENPAATDGGLREQLAAMRIRAVLAEDDTNHNAALVHDWRIRAGTAEAAIARARAVQPYTARTHGDRSEGYRSEGYRNGWNAARAESLAALDGPADTAPPAEPHRYLSTGCLHGEHGYCQANTGSNGAKVPATCKFCGAPCICACHREAPDA